tara:strand:- start:28 stop:402 length:375 start_codon:yes stop_codon:yes gene_type:complete
MYIIIILIVFIVSIFVLTDKKHSDSHGIYLSNTSIILPPVLKGDVKIYNLRYQSDIVGNVGAINALTYVDNTNQFQAACNKNLQKAISLAANNGSDEIKYVCNYPEGKLDQLSSVRLQAYAFKN